MADKRISQLVDRGTIANNDVVPIVVSGATTTNKATISSIQTFMQGNLDIGVTSVGITLGSSGTDVSVSGSPITSSGNITINIPTASAINRGLLSAADWVTFNSKQQAITLTTTGTSGAATLVSGTLNIPNYSTDLSGYVTLGTAQTITAQKTFTTSGSSDTMIISHGSGSGFALDVLKAGSGEAIRVTKTSGSGNAMTISGGNFEAPTIVKTGGTSSQFLKADGSVDSSTYLTTGSASSTYVPYTGATGNVDLGTRILSANNLIANGGFNSGALLLKNANAASLIDTGYFKFSPSSSNTQISFGFSTGASTWKQFSFSSHLITDNTITIFSLPNGGGTLALTSDIPSLAGYVTLATTQTITGAKTFDTTTSDFLILNSTNASGGALTFRRNGTNVGHIGNSGVLGVGILDDLEVRSGIGKGLHLKTDGGKLTLSAGGSVTLDGALNGTSASFTGNLQVGGSAISGNSNSFYNTAAETTVGIKQTSGATNLALSLWNNSTTGDSRFLRFFTEAASTYRGAIQYDRAGDRLGIYGGGSGLFFDGAATFSSSVTANSLLVERSASRNMLGISSISLPTSGAEEGVAVVKTNSNLWQMSLVGYAADSKGLRIYNTGGTGYTSLEVATGAGTAFIVNGSGNVGIGTASPSDKPLTIYNSNSATLYQTPTSGTTNSSGFYVGQTADVSYAWNYNNFPLVFGTNNTERMRITSVGNTQPGADNAYSLGVSGTRWSAVWAANGTIQTSDEREKKDIIDSDLGLDFVNQLRPVSFKWKVGQNVVTSEVVKDDEGNPILDEEGNEKTESVIIPREGKRTHYGLIAQEVEELLDGKDFGGFIHDEETDTKGLRYDQFVPLLIKSIQELNQKIVILESKLK